MSGIITRRHAWAATIAATVILGSACTRESADAKADPAPPTTTVGGENVTVVTSAPIATGPTISGALAAEREATVRAQIAGPIVATSADEGSHVGAGQVLARIDDRTMRDAFLSARSGLTSAQSAADIATRELSRYEKLAEAGAVAERDLEAARRSNVAARSQLADARSRLTLAQKQLDDAEIRAPFAGVVSQRQASAGDVVQPGGAIFTVIDPSSMRLEASVPAAQLSAVERGAEVAFSVSGYPGRSFTGKVTRINPAADPTTGQVRIVVSIPNQKNNLVAGLFAEGRVKTETHTAPTVPAVAVDARGVRPWVLRLSGGRAEKVEVQLGLKDEQTERYEVLSGVAAGDTLLTGAALGITPGTVVRIGAPNDRAATKN
jgi:membrane fusion protein, multidrug efflux system